MSFNKLKRHFEERRLNLIHTLQKAGKTLELSKQHQLYGAIKEIENFLKCIDKEMDDLSRGDFELRTTEPAAVALEVKGKGRKGVFHSISIFWTDRVVGGTKRHIRRTKEKMDMIRDVAREVKKRSR